MTCNCMVREFSISSVNSNSVIACNLKFTLNLSIFFCGYFFVEYSDCVSLVMPFPRKRAVTRGISCSAAAPYHAVPAVQQHLQCSSTCSAPAPAVQQHLQYSSTFSAAAPAVQQHLLYSSTCSAAASAVRQHLLCSSTCSAAAPTVQQHLQYSRTCSAAAPALHQHLLYRCHPFVTKIDSEMSRIANPLRSFNILISK